MRVLVEGLSLEECIRRGCPDCLYYDKPSTSCLIGNDHCVYFPPREGIKLTPCLGCPYGRRSPCVGICMRDLMRDWRRGRRSEVYV